MAIAAVATVMILLSATSAVLATNLTVVAMLPMSDPVLGGIFKGIANALSVVPDVITTIDPDHNYTVQFVDSASSRLTGVKILNELAVAGRPIHALIGDYSSRVTLPVALTAASQRLWHCGVPSSVDFNNKADFPLFYRTAPDDLQGGRALAMVVRSMGWGSANLIAVADPFGQSLTESFMAAAKSLGIDVHSAQQYAPGTTNFAPFLDTVAANGSKVTLLLGFPGDARLIFREAKSRGMLTSEWAWLGPVTMSMYLDSFTADVDKDLADGMFYVFPLQSANPQLQRLRSSYLAKFPNATAESLLGYPLMYLDCLMSVAHGFKRLTAKYGDAAVLAKSYTANLTEFLVPFDGASGPVSYDQYGTRLANWNVVNIVNRRAVVTHEVFLSNNTFVQLAAPRFAGGSATIPLDRPPLVRAYPQWEDGGVQALAAVRALLISLQIAGMVLLFAYRTERRVRQLSLPFLLMIGTGCVLVLASEYFLVGVPTPFHCFASPILLAFGFQMVMASAAAKTYRIYRIFDNRVGVAISKAVLKSHILIRNVGAVLFAQAVLFLIWIGGFPSCVTLVQTRTLLYYACTSSSVAGYWFVLGLSFALNAVLLGVVVVLAYKTRDVDSSFRETSWILYTAQNVLLCAVVVVPLSVIPLDTLAMPAYYVRAVVLIYAVMFAYYALVGRLVVTILSERYAPRTGSLAEALVTHTGGSQNGQRLDGAAMFGPVTKRGGAKRAGSMAVMAALQHASGPLPTPGGSCSATAANLPSASVPNELSGHYPVLRRGSGLGLFGSIVQTWHTHHVYANLRPTASHIVITPPQDLATASKEPGVALGLGGVAFDASPAGVPPGCIEVIHRKTGRAWVVQLGGADEVAAWAALLRPVVGATLSTGAADSKSQTRSQAGKSKKTNGTESGSKTVESAGAPALRPSPSSSGPKPMDDDE
ncbi:hypothetical protein H9P43_000611 [Blastocladiella emersonii ATCC 22665]|nr:hypothetical protein H9P43_000611 [Blastocladiella emersonii ATCC 22665]